MKISRKLWGILGISVFMVNALVGCTGNTTKKVSVSNERAGEVNEYGWVIPEKTLNITYFAGQNNPEKSKEVTDKLVQYILEKFNVNIEKIVYDTNMQERLNLMLASNDYPECIVSMPKEEYEKWKQMNKVLELTPIIEEHGPNLKERYGKYLNRYKEPDGSIYSLANGWGMTYWADTAPQLRWDLYNKIGAPDFITPEQYYDVLKQMAEIMPTNSKGEKTFALGMYKSSGMTNTFMKTFGGMWGLKAGYKVGEDNSITHWVNTDEGLEMLKYLNRIFREGLLDPDSFAMTSEEWGERCVNERYVGFVGPWWISLANGHEKWLTIDENFTEDKRFVHVDVKADAIEHSTYNAKNTLGWGRVILTDKCDNPEDYMRWFDLENTDLGTKLVGWGIPNEEGSVWTLDADTSEWSIIEEQKQTMMTDSGLFNWDAFKSLGSQCELLMTAGVEPMKNGEYAWYDQSFVDEWKQFKDKNLANSVYDFSAFFAITIQPNSSLIDVKQRCTDIISTGWANAITAGSEADCIAILNDMREQCKKAGIEELDAFYTEKYRENIEAWQ